MTPHTRPQTALSEVDASIVVAMAWQDETPFEAIALQFALSEPQVIALMRARLKTRSFRVWRMRVRGRATKHQSKQLSKDLVHTHQASTAAVGQALNDFDNEEFPLPPSQLTLDSLR
ncbi:TIGR03643 family protein [Limnohabitans sp. T6-5]|uniref:TIGR03643 family protein n=1 Tax=Limnohabitans sp. T6-5 TaxID=1100724 RepID=UPI000D376B4E|nr:TIGR03643 family protein [Limnohabitans sp. T6-5]PUE07293.1 TIGR03643 family protein [Limnohabitans sp. T6-5]